MSRILNILDICQQGTRSLGPGLRYAIWTQGCNRHCPGCTSPEGLSLEPKHLIDVDTLAEDIVSRKEIQGISISGGEPFLQAEALSSLIDKIWLKRRELTTLCFTGFNIGDLVWPDAKLFLTYLDVLIDGPYFQELNDNRGLRGSSNQVIHCLTNRLSPWKTEMEQGPRHSEMHILQYELKEVGIPTHLLNNQF